MQAYKEIYKEIRPDHLSHPEIIEIIDVEIHRIVGILDSNKVAYMHFRKDRNTYEFQCFLHPNSESVNSVEHLDGKSYWLFGVNDSNEVATAKMFANTKEFVIYPEVSKRGFYITDISAAHNLTEDGTISFEYEFYDQDHQLIDSVP